MTVYLLLVQMRKEMGLGTEGGIRVGGKRSGFSDTKQCLSLSAFEITFTFILFMTSTGSH